MIEELTVPACIHEFCFNVELIDDSTVENRTEEFAVVLSIDYNSGYDRILLPAPAENKYIIIDTDSEFTPTYQIIGRRPT